jgi:Tol biopolymer transport system component
MNRWTLALAAAAFLVMTGCASGSGSGRDQTPSDREDLIAFVRPYGKGFGLWVVRPDGTGLRRLTRRNEGAKYAEWSPDGGWVAYVGGNAELPSLRCDRRTGLTAL